MNYFIFFILDLQQRRLRELKDEFSQEQEVIKIEFDMERYHLQFNPIKYSLKIFIVKVNRDWYDC